MRVDPGNRFARFLLEKNEEEAGKAATPYLLAILQNKIADYASAVVEDQWQSGEDPHTALLRHEKLKAQVEVLEEFFRDLQVPSEQDAQQSNHA